MSTTTLDEARMRSHAEAAADRLLTEFDEALRKGMAPHDACRFAILFAYIEGIGYSTRRLEAEYRKSLS